MQEVAELMQTEQLPLVVGKTCLRWPWLLPSEQQVAVFLLVEIVERLSIITKAFHT